MRRGIFWGAGWCYSSWLVLRIDWMPGSVQIGWSRPSMKDPFLMFPLSGGFSPHFLYGALSARHILFKPQKKCT